jgi:CheY-like chemotaxis protein
MKSSPLTFSVRFESQDDFLVEYTDRLRHGLATLPLPDPLAAGTKVRLRMHLPDGQVLYLTGATQNDLSGEDGVTVRLSGLSDEAKAAMERCVEAMVGHAEDPDSSGHRGTASLETLPVSVLLVDDSVSMRIELGDALRERGVKVRVADNGLVALSSALKRPPDVVVTDVEMPVMDGWTLLRSIRARKKLADLPVVFLTRLSDELSRLRGYRLGVDDYLSKTMPPEEIVARLQGVVARHGERESNAGSGGMRGALEHVRLGSVLAFLESERRSGVLRVSNGNDSASIEVREGGFGCIDELGRFSHPHDRIFDLLGWVRGSFEFRADATLPGDHTDQQDHVTTLTYLLMEHARREDEDKAAT